MPPDPADRRVAPRFQPAFGTICRIRQHPPHFGLVWNISRTGVSMLVADPLEMGTAVEAELTCEGGGEKLPVVLRVVHVRPADTGDYLIGARFGTPLDDEQMRPFLTPSARE